MNTNDSNNMMNWLGKVGFIYSTIVFVVIVSWNYSRGDLIGQWYNEYMPNGVLEGSGKWRGDDGGFAQIVFVFGSPLYLFSILSICLLIINLNDKQKIMYAGMITLNVVYLLFFIYKGVFTSVSQN